MFFASTYSDIRPRSCVQFAKLQITRKKRNHNLLPHFRKVFQCDAFFENVTTKVYGEIQNYGVSEWTKEDTSDDLVRTMHYEFFKSFAIAKATFSVDQTQRQHSWCTPGLAYGVTSTSRTTGAMYADYFHLDVHTRLERISENETKIDVIVDVVWDRKTIIGGKIEAETLAGVKKYYEVFENEIMSEVSATSKLPKEGLIFEKKNLAAF